jgi:hypothetical protein
METSSPPVQVSCPQCGGPLEPSHRSETFTCPWCGSTLRPDQGIPFHRLRERARVSPAYARGSFSAWLVGNETPAGMETRTVFEVGDLDYFPFLRERDGDKDVTVALAPLPFPEVAELVRVPAEMEEGVPDGERGEPDADILRRELQMAVRDPGLRELLIECRGYYPIRYQFEGEHYTALVDASGGLVHTSRRPARREVAGERLMAAGTVVLLFVAAIVVPGLPFKLLAVAALASGAYLLLKRLVRRYG